MSNEKVSEEERNSSVKFDPDQRTTFTKGTKLVLERKHRIRDRFSGNRENRHRDPYHSMETMMKLSTLLAILGVAFLGFACSDTSHYPLSGEDCEPEDPVQELSTLQCAKAA